MISETATPSNRNWKPLATTEIKSISESQSQTAKGPCFDDAAAAAIKTTQLPSFSCGLWPSVSKTIEVIK